MVFRSLADIERVIRSAWSQQTCDPVERAEWSTDNPARGQCAVTALVVQDLFGGELLLAEVRNADGSRQGVHYWNRLANGVEVDLTREQFTATEIVQEPAVIARPVDTSRGRLAAQYEALASAVRARSTPARAVDNHRPGFVHIGLVVEDLDETVRFLALLGFDCGKPGVFGGEWIDRIIGLEDVKVEVVMARGPDGSDIFEVVRFHSPSAGAQEPAPAANRPGLRHVAFKVDDVRGVVDRVREAGWDTVGEIVDYERTFLLCYVRGPGGLIVELAERLDGAAG